MIKFLVKNVNKLCKIFIEIVNEVKIFRNFLGYYVISEKFQYCGYLWNFTIIFSRFFIKNFKKLRKNFESILEKCWGTTNHSPPPSSLHRNVILLYDAIAKFRYKIYDNCKRKVPTFLSKVWKIFFFFSTSYLLLFFRPNQKSAYIIASLDLKFDSSDSKLDTSPSKLDISRLKFDVSLSKL